MKKTISLTLIICSNYLLNAQITATDNTDIRIFPSSIEQSEVHISINKTNPDNILASSNGQNFSGGGVTIHTVYYFSNDGGVTWSGSNTMPNNQEGYSDPSTAFDASGRGYISVLPNALNGYLIQYSDDNCLTWSNSIRGVTLPSNLPLGLIQDKEMIVCVDEMQSSPYVDNFYCTWSDFNDSGKVKINRSTDRATSFNTIKTLSTKAGLGANVQTGPNGEIYVCWADYDGSNIPAQNLGFAYSNNGGTSYLSSLPFTYNGIKATYGPYNKFGNTRINDFPSMAVDKSCGDNRGRIFVTYPEFDPQDTAKSIIRMRYSDNDGLLWSSATTISINYSRQSWFPWISVDDLTGLVTVIYYSLDGATGFSTNTYVAYSADGGSTWSNVKVSDESHVTKPIDYNDEQYGYAGDYIGISTFGGKSYAAWMDNRTGKWQIYVSRIDYNVTPLISSQTNLEINKPPFISNNRNYQAAQKISLSNINKVSITNSGKVEVVAGQSIEMNPGFETKLGSVFLARIEVKTPCTTPGAIAFKNQANINDETKGVTKEIINGVELFAYPNPTRDFISIGAKYEKCNKAFLQISDLNGKILKQFDSPSITSENIRQIVDLSDFPDAIYIAKLKINGQNYSIKIIKN